MNFSMDPTKSQGVVPPNTNAFTPGAAPTYSFGNALPGGAGDASKLPQAGFSITSTPVQNKPGGMFSSTLGAAPGATTGGGFTFGGSPAGLAIPAVAPSTQTPSLAFNVPASTTLSFGPQSTPVATGFGATVAAPPTTGISFGLQKSATSTALTLGAPAISQPTLPFGATPPQSTAGFNITGTTTTTTNTSGFRLGGALSWTTTPSSTTPTSSTGFTVAPTTSVAPAATGFSLGTAATTSTGFTLGAAAAAATATTTPSFSFTSATAATTSSFGLAKTTTTTAQIARQPTSVAPQTTLGTATTVSSSTSSGQPGAINFCQLEECINKWTLELEEQEKAFVNQATQVNAWDKLLIANGEKIVTLNQEVERVKLEQQQLEHELDYVVGQQKELQDCLVPLEKELSTLSISDPEREYTYRLAESLDTQLKQMSEDLKEIIEHLNEANRSQDTSDPIVQIGKILNAHMNSLQWLDQRTTTLNQKIQQIEQMHQNFRQENERSFNLAYN